MEFTFTLEYWGDRYCIYLGTEKLHEYTPQPYMSIEFAKEVAIQQFAQKLKEVLDD